MTGPNPPEFGYRTSTVVVDLGKRLKALREHNLLYKTTVAAHVGVSPHQVRRFEDGKAIPRFHELLALANLFKVTVEYLAFEAAPPYRIETIHDRFTNGHNRWR